MISKSKFLIIFLLLQFYTFLNADFVKDNNLVKDLSSDLVWQDNSVSDPMLWQDAVSYCERLELAQTSNDLDYDDWRLPNINELKSIVDDTRDRPAIFIEFESIKVFTGDSNYWSSTSSIKDKSNAWYIDFYDSTISSSGFKDSASYYVRCVRGGM